MMDREHRFVAMNETQRAWFDHFKALARSRGGRLVSKEYVNSSTHLEWVCKERHAWRAIPSSVNKGSWCGRCAGVARLSLDDLRAIARANGGECLAIEYVNLAEPVPWRCAEGHEWISEARHMRSVGSWCPRCAGRKTLEDLRAIADRHGGEIISTVAHGAHDKYRWRCKLGHVFHATRASVDLNESWCATCHKAVRGTLARVKRIARKRGGVCLSDAYVSSLEKLDFVCKDGHEFSMKPAALLNHWCPTCGVGVGRSRPTLRLEDLQATAEARGGKCLSPEYFGVRARYEWECARGHRWKARGQPIRAGRWCRDCAHAIVGTIDGFRAYAAALGGECLSTEYSEGQRTVLRFQCAGRHRFELVAMAVKTGVWCSRCG
jgi:hypothetical protein